MKFILFNCNDTNKNRVNNIQLDNINYICEVSLSKKILDSMQKAPESFIQKIKYNFKDKNIEKNILKALQSHNGKWNYIIANNIQNNKYLANKAQMLLGYKFTCENELDTNIIKHIDDYLLQDKALKKHELKILIVANCSKNINIALLENLIKQYKYVNVYLDDKPTQFILKKIKQINKVEGTTIEIVKKERKDFKEYNVIYFIDANKENFPRLRFNKTSLVLDNTTKEMDRYNSNLLFLKDYLSNNKIETANMEILLKTYNKLEMAAVVRKIVNVLDKL